MSAQRNEALGQAEEYKHKAALWQEQLNEQKIKMTRVTQEKIKMERDYIASQRASKSLAKSLESHSSSSDTDYYKRKVDELNGRIQSMHATVAEKNRQLDEMRHQIERNMSQNRWANIGAERGEGKRCV